MGAGGLAHLYFMRLEAEVSGGAKIPILIAAEDVPAGGLLTESALAVREIPRAYVEGRSVPSVELKNVLGAHVASGLRAGETLLWTDLSKFSGRARVLSGLVDGGMRGVAIDGRDADFDGLLRPGDRVDVLCTTGDGAESPGATVTLLQNILVLSVGGSIDRANKTDNARWRAGVVLGATVEQAQLLTQAEQRGHLSLTLRNQDDIAVVDGLGESTAKDVLPSEATPLSPSNGLRARGIDRVR